MQERLGVSQKLRLSQKAKRGEWFPYRAGIETCGR
jgi:hypothetical protein